MFDATFARVILPLQLNAIIAYSIITYTAVTYRFIFYSRSVSMSYFPSAFKSGLTWTADLALFAGGTTTPGVLYPATRVLWRFVGSWFHRYVIKCGYLMMKEWE